jgi:thymidylate kinase
LWPGCVGQALDRYRHFLRRPGRWLYVPCGSPIPAWPDLVLYLDLPQKVVHDRNQGKFPPGSIYTDQDFNAAIRAYFRRLADRKTPRRSCPCFRWL